MKQSGMNFLLRKIKPNPPVKQHLMSVCYGLRSQIVGNVKCIGDLVEPIRGGEK